MSDRDLIAEARNMADVFTDHAVFGTAGKDMMRRLLRDLADALEAAQRPPLGYVVLKKRNATTYSLMSRIQPARASAEHLRDEQIAEQLATDPPAHEEADLFVAEVREVQP